MNDQPLGRRSPSQPTDIEPALGSSLDLPMRQYLGSRLTAEFDATGTVELKVENTAARGLMLDKHVMRQLIDFYMLGQQVLILRRTASAVRPAPAQRGDAAHEAIIRRQQDEGV